MHLTQEYLSIYRNFNNIKEKIESNIIIVGDFNNHIHQ